MGRHLSPRRALAGNRPNGEVVDGSKVWLELRTIVFPLKDYNCLIKTYSRLRASLLGCQGEGVYSQGVPVATFDRKIKSLFSGSPRRQECRLRENCVSPLTTLIKGPLMFVHVGHEASALPKGCKLEYLAPS